MDYRTHTEKLLHEKVLTAIGQLSRPHQYRNDYALLMGTLRDLRVYFDNRERGCPSGLHACQCICEHGIDLSILAIKKRARRKGTSKHAPRLS